MSRTKTILLIAATAVLSACTILNPFIDRRREAGVDDISKLYVGRSTPEEPAVCYNSWLSDMKTIQKLADEECIKNETGTKAVFTDKSIFTCRVLLPNHMYFKCVKEDDEDK